LRLSLKCSFLAGKDAALPLYGRRGFEGPETAEVEGCKGTVAAVVTAAGEPSVLNRSGGLVKAVAVADCEGVLATFINAVEKAAALAVYVRFEGPETAEAEGCKGTVAALVTAAGEPSVTAVLVLSKSSLPEPIVVAFGFVPIL
jgi:hypothetical protein